MRPYYIRCSIVGLFVAVIVGVVAEPVDAVSVIVGAIISVLNLVAFSALIKKIVLGDGWQSSGRGKLFVLAVLVILKLGMIFVAIAVACYFLNPIFVTIGLTSLFLGILWQTAIEMMVKKKTLEH